VTKKLSLREHVKVVANKHVAHLTYEQVNALGVIVLQPVVIEAMDLARAFNAQLKDPDLALVLDHAHLPAPKGNVPGIEFVFHSHRG